MARQRKAPRGRGADAALGSRHANAAGFPEIARPKAKRHTRGTPYTVTLPDGEAFPIVAGGRTRWALQRLREAGEGGCTPITEPAPRWSAYVFNLRELGVPVETLHEPHGGEFSGNHGRYVLRATVAPAAEGEA